MNKAGIVATQLDAHLADRFEERQRFDIPHRAADLNDGDCHAVRSLLDETLNLVGNMRDHLHRAAKIIAAPLFFNHAFVNLAGGEIVALAHLGVDESLIVAEIQIGFCAILGDKHFPMLERAHGARVHVDVRVKLEEGDFDAAGFENGCEGGGSDPFTQGGNHATGYKNILGHEMASKLCAI